MPRISLIVYDTVTESSIVRRGLSWCKGKHMVQRKQISEGQGPCSGKLQKERIERHQRQSSQFTDSPAGFLVFNNLERIRDKKVKKNTD